MVLMKYLYFYIKSLISHPKKVLRIKHGLRKAVKFVSNEIEQCGFFRGTNVVLIRSTKEAGGRRRGAPIAPVWLASQRRAFFWYRPNLIERLIFKITDRRAGKVRRSFKFLSVAVFLFSYRNFTVFIVYAFKIWWNGDKPYSVISILSTPS